MINAILLAVVTATNVPCMTQHRNMTPSVEVSTNLYGSVAGIVDKEYITNALGVATIQEELVSGTNIKMINGNSLLGSGNIEIQGGGGGGGGTSDRITNATNTIMADGRWITKNGETFATNNLCTVAAAEQYTKNWAYDKSTIDNKEAWIYNAFEGADAELEDKINEKADITKSLPATPNTQRYDVSTNVFFGNVLQIRHVEKDVGTKKNTRYAQTGWARIGQNHSLQFYSDLPNVGPSRQVNKGFYIRPVYAAAPDSFEIGMQTNGIVIKSSTIAPDDSRIITEGVGTNLFVTKKGVSEISSSGSAKEVMYIENDAITLRSCPHGTVTNQYDMLTIADDSIEIYKKSGNASNESLKIKVNGETHVQKVDGTTVTSATFKYPNVTGNRTLTIATVEDDIASKASQSDVDTLNASVTAIAGHLNAEDARFVSTNYDYSSSIPEAYVEINMTQNNTSSWVTIWKEMTRWNDWTGSNWNWSVWSGFNEWKTSTENGLQEKANKNWGMYDSEKGTLSPDGYTQISSSNILLCSGMSYERTVTTDGAIWVLRCNNGTMHINGDTNGYFKIVDGDGNSQFEIVKGDRIELGADATGVRVDTTTSPQTLVVEYTIEGATEQPTIQVCDDLSTANWKPDTDPTCLATVTWTYGQGTWTARVQRKTAGDALFVKATYLGGSISYIDHKAPAKFDSIILNGVRYYLGTAVIDNNTVLTLSTTPPNN